MTTSLRIILAAMGVAALAPPVMAQSLITRPYVEQYVAPPADYVIPDVPKALSHTRHSHETDVRRRGHDPH
jgi:hypothetical protein